MNLVRATITRMRTAAMTEFDLMLSVTASIYPTYNANTSYSLLYSRGVSYKLARGFASLQRLLLRIYYVGTGRVCSCPTVVQSSPVSLLV
jgi:hypothetical protein